MMMTWFNHLLIQGALATIIQSPHETVASSALVALDGACVRLAAQAGISDVLAALDDPDEGMPVILLAERIGANPIKLGGSDMNQLLLSFT